MKGQIIKPVIDVIQKRIFLIRNTPAMLDIDMAWLYDVSLQDFLNMVVKKVALPNDFLLRLNEDEFPANRVIQDSFLYAVTENGILMMPALFTDEIYVDVNIALLRAVTAFRNQYSLKLVKAPGKLN